MSDLTYKQGMESESNERWRDDDNGGENDQEEVRKKARGIRKPFAHLIHVVSRRKRDEVLHTF